MPCNVAQEAAKDGAKKCRKAPRNQTESFAERSAHVRRRLQRHDIQIAYKTITRCKRMLASKWSTFCAQESTKKDTSNFMDVALRLIKTLQLGLVTLPCIDMDSSPSGVCFINSSTCCDSCTHVCILRIHVRENTLCTYICAYGMKFDRFPM
jgi:hypothetical protein